MPPSSKKYADGITIAPVAPFTGAPLGKYKAAFLLVVYLKCSHRAFVLGIGRSVPVCITEIQRVPACIFNLYRNFKNPVYRLADFNKSVPAKAFVRISRLF